MEPYLLCSCSQLFFEKRVGAIATVWAFFAVCNIAQFAGWLEWFSPIRTYVWIIGGGSFPAITMAGCLVSTVYLRGFSAKHESKFSLYLVVFGAAAAAPLLGDF